MSRPPEARHRPRGKPRGGHQRRPGRSPQTEAAQTPREDGAARAVAGLLEIGPHASGKLYDPAAIERPVDVTLPAALVQSLGLRMGDFVEALAAGASVQSVTRVNGAAPEALRERPTFERLTAVHPDRALVLGPTPGAITGRLLDLVAPVGRGQRALIVSPPKAGKTTLLREMARGLAHDDSVVIIACLVGERPEEVTELRRGIRGLVLAADLDAPNAAHARAALLGVEYAKRLVEQGRDAVVLLDSLTRLARAHNLDARGGGRTLSGGMDATALQPVRQIFGAARAVEDGGSLTILATCLIDTGSRLDDLVYEEFKGTGNMEVHLDRKLAEQRLFPAVNIMRSGTRHEELLLDPETLQLVTRLRRKLARMPADEGLSALIAALRARPDNISALEEI